MLLPRRFADQAAYQGQYVGSVGVAVHVWRAAVLLMVAAVMVMERGTEGHCAAR